MAVECTDVAAVRISGVRLVQDDAGNDYALIETEGGPTTKLDRVNGFLLWAMLESSLRTPVPGARC